MIALTVRTRKAAKSPKSARKNTGGCAPLSNYKTNPYVHCSGSLHEANVDNCSFHIMGSHSPPERNRPQMMPDSSLRRIYALPEPWSKLLISPLANHIAVPYVIPYIAPPIIPDITPPVRRSDSSSFGEGK